MKAITSITSTTALLLALSGAASAALSTGNLDVDVQSAVGGQGHVEVTLDDGVATLTGFADDVMTRAAAERAAAAYRDVGEVDNRIVVN